MIFYTLGFIFNNNLTKVLLIHKLTPEWQKGKINGLGGKFEENENCFDCIVREVKEEAGLITIANEWEKIGVLLSAKWTVDVMAITYQGKEEDAQSMEKQQVEWFPINKLPVNIISNLSWLIPICKDKMENKEIDAFVTNYTF